MTATFETQKPWSGRRSARARRDGRAARLTDENTPVGPLLLILVSKASDITLHQSQHRDRLSRSRKRVLAAVGHGTISTVRSGVSVRKVPHGGRKEGPGVLSTSLTQEIAS